MPKREQRKERKEEVVLWLHRDMQAITGKANWLVVWVWGLVVTIGGVY